MYSDYAFNSKNPNNVFFLSFLYHSVFGCCCCCFRENVGVFVCVYVYKCASECFFFGFFLMGCRWQGERAFGVLCKNIHVHNVLTGFWRAKLWKWRCIDGCKRQSSVWLIYERLDRWVRLDRCKRWFKMFHEYLYRQDLTHNPPNPLKK